MHNFRLVRRLNLHFSLLWALFWGSYASLWSYRTVFLLHHGFTNSQIGLVSSLALLLPMAVQPLLSSLAGRSHRVTSRALAMALTALSMVCCAGIWLFDHDTVYSVLLIVIGVALTVTVPYFNAMSMEFVMRGVDLNFGASRSCGSVSFSVVSLVMGAALERFAPTLTLPVFLVFSGALLLALLLFRYPLPEISGQQAKDEPAALSNAALLRRYPRFALMLAACFLLVCSQMTLSTFMIQIAGKVGGGESVTGTAYFLSSIVELPAMVLFAKVRRKIPLRTLLFISASFFTVRAACFLVAGSTPVIYLACVLQFFAYALLAIATVYYVTEELDTANQAKGQALIYLIPSGMGAAFGTLCGGWLLDVGGVDALLIFCVLTAAAGTAVMVPALYPKHPKGAKR